MVKSAFRRFCQILADASNLLKNVASALSAKISFLMSSGKPALSVPLFSSLALNLRQPPLSLGRETNLLVPQLLVLMRYWHTCTECLCPYLASFPACGKHFVCISLQECLTYCEETTNSVSTHLSRRWLACLHPAGAC